MSNSQSQMQEHPSPTQKPVVTMLAHLLMAEPIERKYFGTKNTFLQFLSICGEKWQTPLYMTVSRNKQAVTPTATANI